MRISDWSETCALPIFLELGRSGDVGAFADVDEIGAGKIGGGLGHFTTCSPPASGRGWGWAFPGTAPGSAHPPNPLPPAGGGTLFYAAICMGSRPASRVTTGSSGTWRGFRSEEHTSELQSLMRSSYAV